MNDPSRHDGTASLFKVKIRDLDWEANVLATSSLSVVKRLRGEESSQPRRRVSLMGSRFTTNPLNQHVRYFVSAFLRGGPVMIAFVLGFHSCFCTFERLSFLHVLCFHGWLHAAAVFFSALTLLLPYIDGVF